MSKIISFNGVDGSGKTTQIELLLDKYSKYIQKIGNKESFSDPRIADFNWWFIESLPEEFVLIIYECIKNRNELIKKCEKPIILLDKGLNNFDARTIATLMVKGVDENKAKQMVIDAKEKFLIKNIENISLFFEIAKNDEERKKITKERKFSELKTNNVEIYTLYQEYQNMIIQQQLLNNEYHIFDATGSIESVNNRLIDIVFDDSIIEKKYIL